ncbi:MAG: hypothetical protein IJS04_02315 [Muribaculaceae bacterium]|nr:hypothetical protein [Muribaculaceae bacterium]
MTKETRDFDYNGHHYRIVPVEGALKGEISIIRDNRRVVKVNKKTMPQTNAGIEYLFKEKTQ